MGAWIPLAISAGQAIGGALRGKGKQQQQQPAQGGARQQGQQNAGLIQQAIDAYRGSKIQGSKSPQMSGQDMAAAINSAPPSTDSGASDAGAIQMKKGGPVKKTGLYKLHKGEHVLTAKQVKKAKQYGKKKKRKEY